MKQTLCLLAALLLVAPGIRAEEAAPSADPQESAPLSRFSLGFHLAYWNAKDLDELDLDGAFGGGLIGQFRLHQFLALDFRLSGFGATSSDDDYYYYNCGCYYGNETTVYVTPFEAGLVAILPLGDIFSLYGGPGAGYYFFDGEIRRWQGSWGVIYDLDFDDEPGWYALLGVRAQLARNIALFLEGKYTWVDTSLEHEVSFADAPQEFRIPDIQQDLDFSGLAIQLGMLFTF